MKVEGKNKSSKAVHEIRLQKSPLIMKYNPTKLSIEKFRNSDLRHPKSSYRLQGKYHGT